MNKHLFYRDRLIIKMHDKKSNITYTQKIRLPDSANRLAKELQNGYRFKGFDAAVKFLYTYHSLTYEESVDVVRHAIGIFYSRDAEELLGF